MNHLNRLYFNFRNCLSKRQPKIYCFCDQHKGAVKFFVAGGLASATDLVLLFLFHGIFKWPLVLSTSLAFIVSFVVSFTMQKFWTFRNFSQEKAASQFILYILNAFIGLNLNGFLMHLLANRLNVWYLLAQVIVNLSIGFYNYFIYKLIIFRLGKNEINSKQKTIGTGTGDVA